MCNEKTTKISVFSLPYCELGYYSCNIFIKRRAFMFNKVLTLTVLLTISQLCVASDGEFEAMWCKIEANVVAEAAQDRIKGLSINDSIASTNKMLSDFNQLDSDFVNKLSDVMKAKVAEVYTLYSLKLIQNPNFRSYIHGLCLADFIPKSDPSLSVDYRFVEKMTHTFKLALAGSMPKAMVEKLSTAASICMLTEYRAESHVAINEYMTYIADGKPVLDASKLVTASYINDEDAIAAFSRVSNSTKTCLAKAFENSGKK